MWSAAPWLLIAVLLPASAFAQEGSSKGGGGGRQGRLLNPRVSVIGDFIARYREDPPEGEERNLDFGVSELELAFQAAVDPYLQFDVFVALHDEGSAESVGSDVGHSHAEEGFEVHLEEAYVTTLALPVGLQLRGGRFRQRLGRANTQHPHEQVWVDQPTVLLATLGAEQFIDDGVELSWLMPLPFFWELSGAVSRGPAESPTWVRSEDDDFVFTTHSKIFLDLSRASSLELGQSWVRGPAGEMGFDRADVYGLDFTWKWIPDNYRGISWQTEVLSRSRPEATHDTDVTADHHARTLDDDGFYSFLEWRLAKRWSVAGRLDVFEYAGMEEPAVEDRRDVSFIGQFRPSEFQTLRLQIKHTDDDLLASTTRTAYFNWVWAMGAHGAHPF
jgi:hypothetical protein